jgi:hypothetical protein
MTVGGVVEAPLWQSGLWWEACYHTDSPSVFRVQEPLHVWRAASTGERHAEGR